MNPGVPGAPEPRMYPRSGYFLVIEKIIITVIIIVIIIIIMITRKYTLRGYILGSGAPGPQGSTPKTYGATFISELRHLELSMG